ncbi:hypothetical protein ACOKFD_10485 [Flagellimonas sp. S174]|uniref:hypothetical protein n=1 Tax=Flagellimonas sp. S174 TaxID=3410790 RepID=UPI003BF4C9D7
MQRRLLYIIPITFLFCSLLNAQEHFKSISFEHFSESRGDSESGLIVEIPQSQIIVMENSLKTTSGFGMRLNFNGAMVIVDQMEVLRDGRTQVVLRREDGRNFYGYRPTLKAILTNNPKNEKQGVKLVEDEKRRSGL